MRGVERSRMGYLFSSASIATLLGIGLGATFAPQMLAENYGLPFAEGNESARGLVRALGARDAAIGCIALAFTLRGDRDAVRTTLGLATIVAVADFAIVFRTRGIEAWPHLAIHGSGIVGLVLAAAVD